MTEKPDPKRLILRLSSLGDVILTTSALETRTCANGVDWVVAKEYADVLRGHPRIVKLWEYDRKSKSSGFFAWFRFARELWNEGYEEIYDLHASVRTRILHLLFWYWGLREKRDFRWTTATKQRIRCFGFLILKKWWPKRWLSKLQVEAFAKTLGGTGEERPNLSHLLNSDWILPPEFRDQTYVCVMPGSNWHGKTWAGEKYFAVLKSLGVFPIILGQSRDSESQKLVRLLEREDVPHFNGIGRWNLQETGMILSRANAYLGSDTGLAHLAEAVGTPIAVIYGPTAPGLGFEPWRESSRTISASLWCRPCGKIGKYCFRPSKKFHCLKILEPTEVLKQLRNNNQI